VAGEVLIIVVDGWGNSAGNFNLHIQQAPNACGDGIAGPNEVCDGFDTRGTTCASLGLGAGTLGCAPDCSAFDTSGCNGGGGDCCSAHPFPGCNDPAIEACVCAADDYCCNFVWDDICTGEVVSAGCGVCGSGDSCCAVHPTPGCADGGIESCVCAQDNFCCNTEWDSRCVRYVGSLGCGVCTPGPIP
jgi:hypothetical protein